MRFAALPKGPFDLIMADPPWRFASNSAAKPGKNARGHYDTLTLDDIKRLPVWEIAAPHCLLWLWAASPMVPQQLEVASAWGFEFKTLIGWDKRTSTGKQHFGTGYLFRSAMEPIIIATRGKPVTTNSVRSLIVGQVREHSRKPEEAYEAAEQLMPGARRADLFSRTPRPGWTGWGDEHEKFDRGSA